MKNIYSLFFLFILVSYAQAQTSFIVYSKTGIQTTNILREGHTNPVDGFYQGLSLEYEYSKFISFHTELGGYSGGYSDSIAKAYATHGYLSGIVDAKLPLNRIILSAGAGVGFNLLLNTMQYGGGYYHYDKIRDTLVFYNEKGFNKTHIDIFLNTTAKYRITKRLYAGIQYRYCYSVNGYFNGHDKYANQVSLLLGVKL